jgi:hypothetical protein
LLDKKTEPNQTQTQTHCPSCDLNDMKWNLKKQRWWQKEEMQ